MAATNLAHFLTATEHADYGALHRWSVEERDQFWTALWRAVGLGEPPPGPVTRGGPHPWDVRFFPEARLNAAEVILDGLGAAEDAEMIVECDELGARRAWTRREIRARVAVLAAALRSEGVAVGDRVVGWLPNGADAFVAMLAAVSIGATWSSTSPDFGVDGVVDRFGQIEPVVLFAAPGYSYGGTWFDCHGRLAEIHAALPSVRRVVVLGDELDDFTAPFQGASPDFERLPFDHPWYVLYSSGTTGVPKCIVHRAGGVLLQHLKEHQLHSDIRPGDRVAYYTTCGWMMWNWLASVPASGATAVFYDGSPFHPGPSALFDLAEREQLTFLGVSAKFLDSVRKAGYRPVEHHDLSPMRTLASTGSPLAAETFEWVYGAVAPDLHLASISGGTDLCGCFVGGDPTSPVFAGEIQRAALGMAVEVWTDEGSPALADERGELVCTLPFPSMPLRFWGDDGSAYRVAYFERFARPDGEEVWAQGDFATHTSHDGFVIHGRSDTTLNPGGVRIGTAEIYRQVEQIPEVLESLVFGQPTPDGDVRIVLLVRLVEHGPIGTDLAAEIRTRIRSGCTPRHVPSVIAAVVDLPRTRSGKLAELAVVDAVAGREVRNTTALANPESLAVIADLPELRF